MAIMGRCVRRLRERFLPQLSESGKTFFLFFVSDGKSSARFGFTESQFRCHGNERPGRLVEPVHEAHNGSKVFPLGNFGKGLFDVIGQTLRYRAETGGSVFFIAFQILEMGEKDVVYLPVEDILYGAVGDLCREAVAAFHPRCSVVGNLLGHKGLHSRLWKNMRTKGHSV